MSDLWHTKGAFNGVGRPIADLSLAEQYRFNLVCSITQLEEGCLINQCISGCISHTEVLAHLLSLRQVVDHCGDANTIPQQQNVLPGIHVCPGLGLVLGHLCPHG